MSDCKRHSVNNIIIKDLIALNLLPSCLSLKVLLANFVNAYLLIQ